MFVYGVWVCWLELHDVRMTIKINNKRVKIGLRNILTSNIIRGREESQLNHRWQSYQKRPSLPA